MSVISILLIIGVVLNLTIPSEADYQEWLEDEYSIQKSNKLHYYVQEDSVIFDSSTHKKMFGIFTMRQQDFESIHDEEIISNVLPSTIPKESKSEEFLIIRTLEIGTSVIPLDKDNILWKMLMN